MVKKCLQSLLLVAYGIMGGYFHVLAHLPDSSDPVRYIGDPKQSSSDYKEGYHDGQLRPAIGVQNYQILRANRTHPEWSDGLGWTYNHAPMLAYWHGRFYCEYLSNPTGEHIPPGVTFLTTSPDGKNWAQPKVVFPIYYLVKEDAKIEFIHMHQRMGFYVAANDRLLVLAYYGANEGYGVGRVVREAYEDGTFSPIYFIRPNDNWDGELMYPLYTESSDQGFIDACQALLADKVRRVQWWEEDRFAKDYKEFYRVPWIKEGDDREPGKGFSFYTKEDGTIVGFFKGRWVTVSKDDGETWSEPVYCETLTYSGAKVWAQRLDNGRYALVYNPANSPARHPLSIATSDDGEKFDHLVNVHGEVPPKRFWGREKRPGAQYVRGIIEGNGNPPGDDLWVVYSVNKEDMWISRIPVPVTWRVEGPVQDDFSDMQPGGVVTNWNIYSPQWCPVEVVDFPAADHRCLRISDRDPYDYAKAVRVFQQAEEQSISFKVYVESNPHLFDIEIVSADGARLVQIRIDNALDFLAKKAGTEYARLGSLRTKEWNTVQIQTRANNFDLIVNGQTLASGWSYSAQGGMPERIIFRTGEYRLTDDVQEYKSGDNFKPGWDEPGADEPVDQALIYIDDFETR